MAGKPTDSKRRKKAKGPLEPGQIVLDSLLVEKTIGRGGMAMVYQVRSIETGNRWALKVLTHSDPSIRKRLLREGQLQKSLKHPHLIGVKHVVKIDRQPALLMDLAEGPSLQWALRRKHVSLQEATTLFRGILTGVGRAHSAGVIHRDLKPANVLLHNDGTHIVPRVTDFGIAKNLELDEGATQTGTVFGTPAYMAPEQMVDSRAVDRRADIWSLGCILYRMTTGRRAFPQKGALLYAAVVQGQYENPRKIRRDLPDQIVFAIQEMLCLDVNKRVQDCKGVLALLGGKTAIMHAGDIGSLQARAPEVSTLLPTTLPLDFLPTKEAPPLEEWTPKEVSGEQVRVGDHTTTSSLISDMPGLRTLNAMKDRLDAGLSNNFGTSSQDVHSPEDRRAQSPEQPSDAPDPEPPVSASVETEIPRPSPQLLSLTEALALLAFLLGALAFSAFMYLVATSSSLWP